MIFTMETEVLGGKNLSNDTAHHRPRTYKIRTDLGIPPEPWHGLRCARKFVFINKAVSTRHTGFQPA
jgi:hypothetical protein